MTEAPLEQPASTGAEPAPGPIAGLAALVKNALALMINRVELAALELGAIRANLLRASLIFALGLMALWFALACATVLIAVLAWPSMGWKILLLLAGGYAVLAVAAFVFVRASLARGQLSLPATMAELRADRDALL